MKNIPSAEEAFDSIVESIRRMPDDAQRMIDVLVSMQDEWPMPAKGWEAFVGSIEHTNKKRGWDLHIKQEEE